jgi:hypothetical protein
MPGLTRAMVFQFLFTLGAALVFATGCSSRARVAPTVDLQAGAKVPAADNHGDRGEILLWVKNGAGQTRTFRLASEGALNVLGQHSGIIIATTHGDLTWDVREKEVDLDGCDHFDGTPASPTKGSITFTNLVGPAGDVVQKVVDPTEDGGGIEDLQHGVDLVGTIGPYLFIQESSYTYACGAHGNTTVAATVWDAEQGKIVNLLAELPAKEKLATQAQRKLDEEDVDTGGIKEEEGKPEPAQLLPVYGERGALRIDAQFARWACYACSDGMWSSYTRSAVVPTEWVPERLKAWVMPPVVVKEFLETHRDWHLGGWSRR